MREILLSLLFGGVTGVLFSMFSLPVPAPANVAGVMGIVGLFLGYVIGQYLRTKIL
jgi:XapX domain-containing protein